MLVLCALGLLSVLAGKLPASVAYWRADIQGGLWGILALLALVGAVFRLEGELAWLPIFGVDGPAWPMVLVLAFAGGCARSDRAVLACVLSGFGFLAISPLVFGLLAGTALALLAGRGWRAFCLPFAVLPACIPADSALSVPLLCLTIVQTGWAVSVQRGAVAVVPACTGVFLLGRILAERGDLPLLAQAALLGCGAYVALRGCVQAFRADRVEAMLAGVATAWYGGLVLNLVLALVSALDGADTFGVAFRLGMGPCLLGLLAVLGVGDGALPVVRGRILTGLGVFQLSLLPPSGGFAVLWSQLVAAEDSITGARPAVALVVLLLVGVQCAVMVCATLGLIRAVLPRACAGVSGGGERRFWLPVWCCAGAAGIFSLLPGLWLFVANAVVAGPAASPLGWGSIFVISAPDGESSLTPLLVLFAVAGAFCAVGLLVRLFGFLPFGQAVRQVPAWRQGMPLMDGPAPDQSSGAFLPMTVAWARLWGLARPAVAGRRGALPVWRSRRSAVLRRYARRGAFRVAVWCETQGMMLVLLLLGVGLLVGLFAGT